LFIDECFLESLDISEPKFTSLISYFLQFLVFISNERVFFGENGGLWEETSKSGTTVLGPSSYLVEKILIVTLALKGPISKAKLLKLFPPTYHSHINIILEKVGQKNEWGSQYELKSDKWCDLFC
jgi:hypothetical protein